MFYAILNIKIGLVNIFGNNTILFLDNISKLEVNANDQKYRTAIEWGDTDIEV